jgi:hypothetical protein
MNLVFICQAYGACIANNQITLLNFAKYRPPHQVRQAALNPPLGHWFQPHNCGTCGNKHPPGKIWIENQVVCSNCGRYHPTNRCNKPDKVNPLKTTKWFFF